MTALKTLNEGEASFDEVLTFAFYTLSMKQRQGKEEETAEAHFLQAAHFMLQNASWDPYKQMMLKIILNFQCGMKVWPNRKYVVHVCSHC